MFHSTTQLESLSIIASKTGLQISFQTTEIMTNIEKFPKKSLETGSGTIKYNEKFKYQGETVSKK